MRPWTASSTAGTILGEVQVEAGVAFPETPTLTLEPSRVAEGRTGRHADDPVRAGPARFQLRPADGILSAERHRRRARIRAPMRSSLANYGRPGSTSPCDVSPVRGQRGGTDPAGQRRHGRRLPRLPDRSQESERRPNGRRDGLCGGLQVPGSAERNWIIRTGHPVHSATSPQPVRVTSSPSRWMRFSAAARQPEIETTDA